MWPSGSIVWILLEAVPARVVVVDFDDNHYQLEPEENRLNSCFYRRESRVFASREDALSAARK